MATLEEIFGNGEEPNLVQPQIDTEDIASDAKDENGYYSHRKNVYNALSGNAIGIDTKEDNSWMNDVFGDSPYGKSTGAQRQPHERPDDQLVSLLGKGISLYSEIMRRFNVVVASSPQFEVSNQAMILNAKNFNNGLVKAAQYIAMANANGEISREEALKQAEDIVGVNGDNYKSTKSDWWKMITPVFSLAKWGKFLTTVKSAITPTADSMKMVDNKTIGEKLGEGYYKTLTGEDPSLAYKAVIDFSAETMITAPIVTADVLQKAGTSTKLLPSKPLLDIEKNALSAYHTSMGVEQLAKNPSLARAELKRISGLSKYSSDVKLERTLTRQALNYKKALEEMLGTTLREERAVPTELRQSGREILDWMLDSVEPAKKKAGIQLSTSRARKYRAAVFARGSSTGEQAAKQARWSLSGDDFIHDFEIDLSGVTQEARDTMFDVINALPEWDAQHASSGLWKILDKKLPTRSEILALEKAFGEGVMDNILRVYKGPIDPKRIFVDVMNINRAIQSSSDMSFPLRQGRFALQANYGNEWADSVWKMIRSGFSKDYAESIDRAARTGWKGALYQEAGLDLTDISKFSKLSSHEEAFQVSLADKIPVLGRIFKWSERVYATAANQLRMNIFDWHVAQWQSEGRVLTKSDLKSLAEYVNHMTSRGDLNTANRMISKAFGAAYRAAGKDAPQIKKLTIPETATGILYSPRMFLSQIQILSDAFPVTGVESPLVRKLAARNLVNYYYNNMQFLRLAKAASPSYGWEVEDNPNASNFGKLTVGNTKYDVWGPMAQLMKYVSQLETGTAVSSTTGQERDINRKDLTIRFLRSKLSPTAGLVFDLLEGETFVGNDIELTTKEGLGEIAYEYLVPLTAQDIIDVFRYGENGTLAKLASGSAFFGESMSSYEPSPFQKAYLKKEKLSNELFGKPIDQLSAVESMSLLKVASIDPEIAMLERQGMYERSDDLGEYAAEEQRESEKTIKKKLSKDVREILDSTSTNILGVSRRVSYKGLSGLDMQLNLNRSQYNRYKDIVAENITGLLSKYRISDSNDINLLYVDSNVVDKLVRQAVEKSQQDIIIEMMQNDMK